MERQELLRAMYRKLNDLWLLAANGSPAFAETVSDDLRELAREAQALAEDAAIVHLVRASA